MQLKTIEDQYNYLKSKIEESFKSKLKGKKWQQALADNSDTPDYENCNGFEVTQTGSLTIIDTEGNEMSWAEITAGTSKPYVPKKVKTGSTAVIHLIY